MQHKNKIAFNDIESGTMQDITRKFIDNHIIYNQSYLVSELISKEVISLEDHINYYKSDKAIKYDFGVSTDEKYKKLGTMAKMYKKSLNIGFVLIGLLIK